MHLSILADQFVCTICVGFQTPDREFLIRISYMEIYNENVVDLLGDVKKSLNVYDTVVSDNFPIKKR